MSSEFTGGLSAGIVVTGDELRFAKEQNRKSRSEDKDQRRYQIDLDRSRVPKIALGDNVVVSAGVHKVYVHEGNVVGHDINISEHQDIQKLSAEQAFERIGAAFRLNLQQLEKNVGQARDESNQFFRFTLFFSGLAFLVILSAVGLVLADQVAAGIVASISSLMPKTMGLLFFKKDRELRRTIETYHNHILDSQRSLTMIDVAETISNQSERDRIKQEIILSSLGVETESPTTLEIEKAP